MSKCTAKSLRNAIIFVIIIIMIILAVFGGFSVYSWIEIVRANTSTTTTFIGSSDEVLLGCWAKNAVDSININKTKPTKVYSSDKPPTEVLKRKTLWPQLPQYVQYIRFQMSYNNNPFYNIQSTGYVVYNITVIKLNETENENCTLEIFTFDSLFDSEKFFISGKSFRYTNRICLVTNKTEDFFLINISLPALQYTYITGKVNSGVVKDVIYFVVEGFVTTYDTSKLTSETICDIVDDTCSVSIGGKFDVINSAKRCIYVVHQPPNGNWYNYEYIRADIKTAYIPAIVFTCIGCVAAISFVISFVSGLMIYFYRWRKKHMAIPVQATPGELTPLVEDSSTEGSSFAVLEMQSPSANADEQSPANDEQSPVNEEQSGHNLQQNLVAPSTTPPIINSTSKYFDSGKQEANADGKEPEFAQ